MQIRKKSKSQLHKQLKRAPLKAGDVLLKRSFNSREIQCGAPSPEHWCQVTSQSPENNSQVVCHASTGCPFPRTPECIKGTYEHIKVGSTSQH